MSQIYRLLADLLDYPTPDLPNQAGECAALLAKSRARAAQHLERFRDLAERTPLGALEELYTSAFDLQPVCYPYVGYQLFGDTYKRGEFLARLKEHYREHGFAVGRELPDHLPVMMRYLASQDQPDQELIADGLLPALNKMLDALRDHPYGDVMRALRLAVQGE
jgi:nitrate reductase delta subunit